VRLLAGVSYDPAAAVTKATTALLAMTAFDTTNLRLASITVPSHGMLRWRIICAVHGATTLPSILLGVLEGATVRGRVAPMVGGGNLVATGRYQHEATGLITGLTPGASVTLDAAYGVEVIVATTGIKYGGPNNTTTNDAFGAIVFEVFDPAPAAGSGSGASAQEVWEYATRSLTDKAGFGLADSAITAAKIAAAALNDKGNWNVGKTGYALTVTPPTAAQTATAVRTELTTELGRIDAAVSTRLAAASYTAPDNTTIAAIAAKTTNLPSDPADQSLIIAATEQIRADIAAIETGGGGTGPTAAEIRAELDANSTKLANLDAAISTRMATFEYTAPANADIAAIKAQTDKFNWTGNHLHVNTCLINGITVIGGGVAGNRWRAA
jgi:hypothetical protein